MPQQGSDLTFVEVERKVADSSASNVLFVSVGDKFGENRLIVDLGHVLDRNSNI